MLNATFRLNRPCFVLVRPGFDVAMIWTGTVETEYVFTVLDLQCATALVSECGLSVDHTQSCRCDTDHTWFCR